MKTSFVVALGVAAGLALGLGLAWVRFSPDILEGFSSGAAALQAERIAPPAADAPQPIATIAEDSFDFGDIEAGDTVEHGFRLKNDGAGPLLLRKGGTTCGRCTVSNLPRESLAPGETERIGISYQAHEAGPFRQTATILTNDAARPRVEITIGGTVFSPLRASPADIVFTRLSTYEPTTAETRLLAYGAIPLEITGHEFLDPETAGHFQVDILPLTSEEVAREAARSGMSVKVTALAGLPIGAVRQKLRLTTNQPKTSVVEVPIQGIVESDLSIVGPGWDREHGMLAIGAVSRGEGMKRQLFVLARGEHRQEVQLKIVDRDPPWIQAELGAPEIAQQGAVVRWPLTVIIPPDSPEVNRLGTAQGKLGKLVLGAASPDAIEIKLYLQFLVEE
jgi:hypothetical protein